MKLTEKIHLLRLDFQIKLSPEKVLDRFVNCIIIFGEQITLIDTGVKGCEHIIFDYIRQNNRSASEIRTIILSHSHPDHIGSANQIKKLTNCSVWAHPDERNWMEDIRLQNQQRPVPGFFNLVDQPVLVDRILEDQQIVKVDNSIILKFIHSPGHSKGSLNILFIEDRILFTADSIPLKNDIPNYDNYPELCSSLNAIKENQGFDILLTSWTPPLMSKSEWTELINDGEKYIRKIDSAVKESYGTDESEPLQFCGITLNKLCLPPFLKTPLVDQTFRSHLNN